MRLSAEARRMVVLRELAWLCDEAPAWAQAEGGWWWPYHVVFFRGSGGPGRHGSLAHAAGVSVDSAQDQLRLLAKAGLVDRQQLRVGSRVEYRINEAGREVLAGAVADDAEQATT